VPRPTIWLVPLAAAAVLLAGCSSEEPAADPDRIVLKPPAEDTGHPHAPGDSDPATIGDGTLSGAGGYRLAQVRLPRRTDGPGRLSFRIVGSDGQPVTAYAAQQTKLMHLYVVRSDLAVYRHLHPTLSGGTWRVLVDLGEPGDYRVIADFLPADGEQPVVLGAEATVPGSWRAEPLSPGGTDGTVRVRVDGTGEVGAYGRLYLDVSTADGGPVLGSYLGTTAHVSGLRTGGTTRDRVFVHVHPYGEPERADDATRLTFHTTFEHAGDYRLFVQVRVDGILHTVPVTATVDP